MKYKESKTVLVTTSIELTLKQVLELVNTDSRGVVPVTASILIVEKDGSPTILITYTQEQV